MGQGTESCGGYEVDYDPYDDGLRDGLWTQSNGSTIRVSDMSTSHINNAIRVAQRASYSASFTSDSEKWDEWVNVFRKELAIRRSEQVKDKAPKPAPKPVRGSKVWMVCACGTEYPAREADLKRGWGLSCSKSCAAIRRDFGRPAAKRKKVAG